MRESDGKTREETFRLTCNQSGHDERGSSKMISANKNEKGARKKNREKKS